MTTSRDIPIFCYLNDTQYYYGVPFDMTSEPPVPTAGTNITLNFTNEMWCDIDTESRLDILLVSGSIKYWYSHTICINNLCPIPTGKTFTILVEFKIPEELGTNFQFYPYLYKLNEN
ncbi:4838_t:CDS:1, partial [Racocetra fulgida]